MKSALFQGSGKILPGILGILVLLSAVIIGVWMPSDHSDPRPAADGPHRHAAGRDGGLVVVIYPSPVFAPAIISNGGLEPDVKSVFSEKYKIPVHLVLEEKWDSAAEGLARGDYDIIWGTPDMLARYYPELRGVNPSAFLQAGWSHGMHAVAASAGVRSASDFRKKTIACVKGSPSHFLALYLIDLKGVKPESLRWAFAGTEAEAANTFRRKRADLLSSVTLLVSESVKKRGDASVILSTADASGLLSDIFITREETIITSRDALTAFASGWMDGVAVATAKPDDAAKALSGAFGTIGGDPVKALEEVALAGYHENAVFFGLAGSSPNGFSWLFETAVRLHAGEGEETAPVSSLARSVDILAGLPKEYTSMKKTPSGFTSSPAKGIRQVSAPLALDFPLNGTAPGIASHSALRGIAHTASVFPQSFITITVYVNPAEDRWLNLTGKRAQEIIDSISTDRIFPRERFIIYERPAPEGALRRGAEVGIALPVDDNAR